MQNVYPSLLVGRITEMISPTPNHIWTFNDISAYESRRYHLKKWKQLGQVKNYSQAGICYRALIALTPIFCQKITCFQTNKWERKIKSAHCTLGSFPIENISSPKTDYVWGLIDRQTVNKAKQE